MTRASEIRGGTFGRLRSAGVLANGWWLWHAADVDLQSDRPSLHDISRIAAGAPLEPSRFRMALRLALQITGRHELPIGFLAGRIEDAPDGDKIEIGYPFVLQESEGRVCLAFGARALPRSCQDEIVTGFVERMQRALAPATGA